MKRDFSTQVTGSAFLAAGLLLWLGWMLLPTRIGTFFQVGDFSAVGENLTFWIWMYRIHFFGVVVSVMALVALGALLADTEARILIWPGVGVAAAGLMVGAAGAAFYYHFGAWGALEMAGKSGAEIRSYVDSLRTDTEYITCLVRFGRVFSGFGLLVTAAGLLKWNILPAWLGVIAAVIGLGAMAVIMGFPDDLHFYLPIFHVWALWLAATGIVTLRSGVRVAS